MAFQTFLIEVQKLQIEAQKKARDEKAAADKARKDKDKAPPAACKNLMDVQPGRRQTKTTKRKRKLVDEPVVMPTSEQKRPKRKRKNTSRLSL